MTFIVARSWPQHFIGYENKLLWKLKTDMRFFKKSTVDHAVIMGRKTYDSIGRPLPDRMNIVLSRSPGNDSQNLKWVSDRESALFLADIFSILNDKKEIFVIGGENIYSVFGNLFNKIFLTQVFHSFENGDASYDTDLDKRQWKIVEEIECPRSDDDEFPFRITIFDRREKTVRRCDVDDFLHDAQSRRDWISERRLAEKAMAYEEVPEEQFSLHNLLSR